MRNPYPVDIPKSLLKNWRTIKEIQALLKRSQNGIVAGLKKHQLETRKVQGPRGRPATEYRVKP